MSRNFNVISRPGGEQDARPSCAANVSKKTGLPEVQNGAIRQSDLAPLASCMERKAVFHGSIAPMEASTGSRSCRPLEEAPRLRWSSIEKRTQRKSPGNAPVLVPAFSVRRSEGSQHVSLFPSLRVRG
jgi:hypothetical protein